VGQLKLGAVAWCALGIGAAVQRQAAWWYLCLASLPTHVFIYLFNNESKMAQRPLTCLVPGEFGTIYGTAFLFVFILCCSSFVFRSECVLSMC